jgi:hypothetical protein
MFHAVDIVCHSIYFSSSNGDIIRILGSNADKISQVGAITMSNGENA